ncbi:MAG: TfoX/Sxy family protein [Chloroflexi bacterium]|nr:TfoX/Sxy family protein [Chloroflexota bacterium]
MTSDRDVADTILSRLAPLPVTTRQLFGLSGLYLDGQYFGFVSDGKLYFRTDEASRESYQARGMSAFQPSNRPRGPKTVDRNFQVPPDVLDNEDTLRTWATRAAEAAKRR